MSEESLKGGRLARRAAMLCQDKRFCLYLDRKRAVRYPEMGIEDGTHTADDARDFIVNACGIESRAELDHNPAAAQMFHKICASFQRWGGGVG